MRLAFCAIVLVSLSSCQPTKGNDTIDDEQFISIYVAMLEKEAEPIQQGNSDSLRAVRSRKVLEEFGISEEKFRAKVDSYRLEPQKWQVFLEEVTKRLDQKNEAQKQKTDSTAAGRTEAPR